MIGVFRLSAAPKFHDQGAVYCPASGAGKTTQDPAIGGGAEVSQSKREGHSTLSVANAQYDSPAPPSMHRPATPLTSQLASSLHG
jgi:hypothetical protein